MNSLRTRLVRDYQALPVSSQVVVKLAMVVLVLGLAAALAGLVSGVMTLRGL